MGNTSRVGGCCWCCVFGRRRTSCTLPIVSDCHNTSTYAWQRMILNAIWFMLEYIEQSTHTYTTGDIQAMEESPGFAAARTQVPTNRRLFLVTHKSRPKCDCQQIVPAAFGGTCALWPFFVWLKDTASVDRTPYDDKCRSHILHYDHVSVHRTEKWLRLVATALANVSDTNNADVLRCAETYAGDVGGPERASGSYRRSDDRTHRRRLVKGHNPKITRRICQVFGVMLRFVCVVFARVCGSFVRAQYFDFLQLFRIAKKCLCLRVFQT